MSICTGEEMAHKQEMLISILDKFGPLSLDEIKVEFSKLSQEIPFARSEDKVIHNWLASIPGIKHDLSGRKLIYRFSKRKHSSPIQSAMKRSRSAPDNDNEATTSGNEWNSRQLRGVRFSDQQDSPTSSNNNSSRSRSRRQQATNHASKDSSRSKSEHRAKMLMGAPNLYGSYLIGDDFFLGLSIFKLKFHGEKRQGILQAGMCISGLTLAAAKSRIQEMGSNIKTAIICLGSIDIAIGRELIQMMQDLLNLLVECINNNIRPVLCTLPPLPNYMLGNRKETWIGFNQYICANPLEVSVIDLQKCFSREGEDTYENVCYINHPRVMSGCRKALILWSNEGRDRAARMLLKNMGLAMLSDKLKVFSYH